MTTCRLQHTRGLVSCVFSVLSVMLIYFQSTSQCKVLVALSGHGINCDDLAEKVEQTSSRVWNFGFSMKIFSQLLQNCIGHLSSILSHHFLTKPKIHAIWSVSESVVKLKCFLFLLKNQLNFRVEVWSERNETKKKRSKAYVRFIRTK